MTQTLAIFLDAYRELQARKLFWITLAISAIIVVAYGSIGFDENGITLLFGVTNFEMKLFTHGSIGAKTLYLGIFSHFIVGIWLAWIAVILALVSTTSIFPDLISGGSIDLMLAKPISRIKLFAMKYVSSLLFVLLQASVFCAGVFLCVGWRVNEWKWELFLVIPILVAFFSYLYAVNVLLGMLTRSGLAALMLTLVFWFGLWAIQTTEETLNQFKTQFAVEADFAQTRAHELRQQLDSLAENDPATEPRRARLEQEFTLTNTTIADSTQQSEKLSAWHTPIRAVLTVLPKTAETVGLFNRWLTKESEPTFIDILMGNIGEGVNGNQHASNGSPPRTMQKKVEVETMKRLEADYRQRPAWLIVGTSLAFEAVVLIVACGVFVRRDF